MASSLFRRRGILQRILLLGVGGRSSASSMSTSLASRQRRRLRLWSCTLATFIFTLAHLQWQQAHERWLESKHPLSSANLLRRRRRRRQRQSTINSLRILSLGSSSTWGVDLEHADSQSYPALLGADNAAVRHGAGLALSAACTQSMVGSDKTYDVITIEFAIFDEAAALLTQRVRARFPHATILLLRTWHPGRDIVYTSPSTNETINLDTFRRHYNLSYHSKELYMRILESSSASDPAGTNLPWKIPAPTDRSLLTHVARETDAHFYGLPKPSHDVFVYPQTLHSVMTMFHADSGALSALGHDLVARGLQALIMTHHVPRSSFLDDNSAAVGTWGSGDDCRLWYTTGDVPPMLLGGQHHSLVEFAANHNAPAAAADHHKHAIEVPVHSDQYPRRGLTVTIHNPFDVPRMLHVSYMTAADLEDKIHDQHSANVHTDDDVLLKIYPTTRVWINGEPSVALEPYHEQPQQQQPQPQPEAAGTGAVADHARHVARTSAVGTVPPGRSTLHWESTEPSKFPFRWIGAAFLEPHAVDQLAAQLEFDYETEVALVGGATS